MDQVLVARESQDRDTVEPTYFNRAKMRVRIYRRLIADKDRGRSWLTIALFIGVRDTLDNPAYSIILVFY